MCVPSSSQKWNIAPVVRKDDQLYFLFKIGDQEKKWAPYLCCNICETNLSQWLSRKKKKSVSFTVAMIWIELTDNAIDCYFCMVSPIAKAILKKKRNEQCNNQTFHQLCAMSLIMKIYPSQKHRNCMELSQMMGKPMKTWTMNLMTKIIIRHQSLNYIL